MTKDHILIALSESPQTKFGKEPFASLSHSHKVFSAIWAVESEVNNGGFSQYFLNESAETVPFVAEALDAMGAPKTADISRRAITCAFPDGLPRTTADIRSAAADFSDNALEALEPLDDEFFAYPHNLADLLFAFLSKYPQEFGPLPKPDDA